MYEGEFLINDVHSKSLNAVLLNRPIFPVPKRKNRIEPIPRSNGVHYFDEDAYENSESELVIYIKADSQEELEYFRGSLISSFDAPGYISFSHYANPDFIYLIHLDEMLPKNEEPLDNEVTYLLNVSIHPFKFYRKSDTFYLKQKPTQLTNPFFYPANPIFKIFGNGDCTLAVNGKNFVIKNIVNNIIVDSEIEHCYSNTNGNIKNENEKVFTMDYPIFGKGENGISWTGEFEIEVEPRWNTLI